MKILNFFNEQKTLNLKIVSLKILKSRQFYTHIVLINYIKFQNNSYRRSHDIIYSVTYGVTKKTKRIVEGHRNTYP